MYGTCVKYENGGGRPLSPAYWVRCGATANTGDQTPRPDDTTDAQHGRPTDWLDVDRRSLLGALGVGAALSFGSGAAAASRGAHGALADEDEEGDDIHSVFGYPTTDAGDLPEDLAPDHEVQLLAALPAGPDQPFFVYFEPAGLQVEQGDVVQFTAMTPDHTVTAMHPEIGPGPRVPEGSSPFSSPVIGPGMAWLYRFEEAGVYDVYCGPHFLLGMVMRLVVGDVAEADLPEYARSTEGLPTREDLEEGLVGGEEGNCEWPAVLPAEVLGAGALDPMLVQAAGEVPFAAVAEELGYEFRPPGEGGDGGGGEADELPAVFGG